MQSFPEPSWGDGLSISWSPHSSVLLTCPQENARLSQGRAPPRQQNTQHPDGSRISIHPCPPWRYRAPHSSADQGPRIPPKTQGQTQPWPCLGAGARDEDEDENDKEQRQSPEKKMHPLHGKLHEHPKNTTEAPSPLRRDRSGSRRWGSTLLLPMVWELTPLEGSHSRLHPGSLRCCASGRALLPAPRASWCQGCCACHVMGHCLQEQAGMKEKTWSLS